MRAVARLAVAVCLSATPALGQQQEGPIRLFPELDQPRPERPGGTDRPGPAPGEAAPGAFQVEGLEAPAIDDIGLGDAGFGPELWQGSDGEVVLALLAELPPVPRNPPLRELTRRLLVTGAPLEGPWEPGTLLEVRVDRLIAMGDLAAAGELLRQLPPSGSDSALLRQAARVALWVDNDEQACALTDAVAPGTAAPFWQQLVVFCRLREGDVDGASLALGLLREAGPSTDEAFFRLADMIANGDLERGPPAVRDLSALHVALLRLGELPAPPAALQEPAPVLIAAIAHTPALAPRRALEFAERAVQIGVLSAQELTARYLEQAPEAADADVVTRIGADWSPGTRALAFQRLVDAPSAVVRAEILDALWDAAEGAERFLVARAFARPYAEVAVQSGLVFAAESMAGALLAGRDGLAAARWFNLLQANSDGNRQAAAGAARLAPLLALAGFGGSAEVPEPDDRLLGAWRANTADADAKAALLYALLDGVGAPVPERVWWQPLLASQAGDRPLQRTTALPAAPVWRSLARAREQGRRGDVILLALHMLEGQPPAAWPEAVIAGLDGLRRVGQDRTARDVAVAAALAAGLAEP